MAQQVTLLLAGATGQLGRGLVSVCEAAGITLVPIARSVGSMSGRKRLHRTFQDRPEMAENAVTGDVTRPRWSLTDDDLDRLAPEVDMVVNVSAETNWSAARRRLQSVNVLGALHGLDVAEALNKRHPRCNAYVHGSSIYVAGGQVGRVPEALLGPRRDRSAYEHSKWLAEHHLVQRARTSRVSVGLARIGGLLGDSVTGRTSKRNSLYMIADRASSGRGLLPVTPGGRVDMLPRDVAAKAFLGACRATLRLSSCEPQITHVCAGEQAPTLAAVLAALEQIDTTTTRRRPLAFPAPERAVFEASAHLPELLRLRQRARNHLEGLRYLCLERVFERDRLARFLPYPPPAPSAELLARLAFDVPEMPSVPRAVGHTFARFT